LVYFTAFIIQLYALDYLIVYLYTSQMNNK
jgi:hypothetical protein